MFTYDAMYVYNLQIVVLIVDVNYKIKIHSSSCEIKDFVETHLCKLCNVILRSRVSSCVYRL